MFITHLPTFSWARGVVWFATEPGSLAIFTSSCGYFCRCHTQSFGLLFQGSGLPLSGSGSWLGSTCRVHIPMQELQAVATMLCRMAFCLSDNVGALHLNNSTAKFICIIKVVQYLLFFPGWPAGYWVLTDKHIITLIPAYISAHLNVEANYLLWGQFFLKWHFLPHIAWVAFHLWGLPEVNLWTSSHTNVSIIISWKLHYLWGYWGWMPSTILGSMR